MNRRSFIARAAGAIAALTAGRSVAAPVEKLGWTGTMEAVDLRPGWARELVQSPQDALNAHVFASSADGTMYRLEGQEWEAVTEQEQRRLRVLG